MEKVKKNMTGFAMQAGFGLGGFWVFKYLFVIGASQYPALEYVNTFLSFLTPLLLLFYIIQFKNTTPDKKLNYWKGVQVGVMLFFFASIIESVIIFAHIVWINPAYISIINQQTINLAQSLDLNETMMDELKKQSSFSPFLYVFRQLMSNVFIGFFLSLLLSPVASRINLDIKKINN